MGVGASVTTQHTLLHSQLKFAIDDLKMLQADGTLDHRTFKMLQKYIDAVFLELQREISKELELPFGETEIEIGEIPNYNRRISERIQQNTELPLVTRWLAHLRTDWQTIRNTHFIEPIVGMKVKLPAFYYRMNILDEIPELDTLMVQR